MSIKDLLEELRKEALPKKSDFNLGFEAGVKIGEEKAVEKYPNVDSVRKESYRLGYKAGFETGRNTGNNVLQKAIADSQRMNESVMKSNSQLLQRNLELQKKLKEAEVKAK